MMFSTAVAVALCVGVVVSGHEVSKGVEKSTSGESPLMWFMVQQVHKLQDQVKDLQIRNLTEEIKRLRSNDNQQKSSIQDIYAQISKPSCQSGTIYIVDWPSVGKESSEVSSKTKTIAFTRPFTRMPVISIGIVRLDAGNDRNTRVDCQWSEVKNTSFKIKCHSWSNTQLWSVTVAWIAC